MAMRFANIKISNEGVSLDRVEKVGSANVKTVMDDSAGPLPSFRAALQAFSGYACDLLGAPEWHEGVNVTSIHLSEDPKTNRRGLIVTITRKIERAKNRVMVTNTPLMHAPAEDQEGTNPGTYPKEVADMIVLVESEAAKYWSGEREQGEMFDREQTEKKPLPGPGEAKHKKPAKNAGTPGEVVNPGSTVVPGDDALRKVLLDAGRDVPLDVIATRTSAERDAAQRWASAQLRVQSGDLRAEAAPKEPKWLKEHATPELAGMGASK